MRNTKRGLIIVAAICIVIIAGVVAILWTTSSTSMMEVDHNDALPDKEIEQLGVANTALEAMRSDNRFITSEEMTRMEIVLITLNQLAEEGLVDGKSITSDEENGLITYYYSSGVLGIEELRDPNPEFAGNGAKNSATISIQLDNIVSLPVTSNLANSSPDIEHPDVLILYAWGDGKTVESEFYAACESFTDQWREKGLRVGLDQLVTLDDLTLLGGNELIYIAAHGQYAYWPDGQFRFSPINSPIIKLKHKQNSATDKKFAEDLKNQRVGICNGEYCVLPDFFQAHYSNGKLNGSIIFFGSCELMGKEGNVIEDFTNALKGTSVEAFVAFHNENYIKYHMSLLYEFVDQLMSGATVSDALNVGIQKYGENDLYWMENIELGVCPVNHLPAYPLLRGNRNAKLKYVENLMEFDYTESLDEQISEEFSSTELEETNTYGNTNGNIGNYGLAAIQGDKIYYANKNDGGSVYIIKTDGSEKKKLSNGSARWLNVVGDQIYFQDSGYLYSMKTNGSNMRELNDRLSFQIQVVGDQIYYSNESYIYGINVDGDNKHIVYDTGTSDFNFVVSGNKIFYTSFITGSGWGFYSLDLDGSNMKMLSEDAVHYANVNGEWIYYSNGSDHGRLYKMKVDGTNKQKLSEDRLECINVSGEWIYCINQMYGALYKVKFDGSEGQILTDDKVGAVNVVGDRIFYMDCGGVQGDLYTIKIDGSGRQLVD